MRIRFFKKEKNFKKKTSELNPNIFWISLCYAVFIVFILSCFFGYYLFIQINKDPAMLTTDESNTQVEIIKKERIDKDLDYFSLKEQKSNQIINSPSPIIDPSL